MKKYTHTSIFASSPIKCVVDKEKDELLALASLEQLRVLIPDAAKANNAFLPVAFNAFTPNRVNKNDDVIDTKTALAIYKKFINTPINIEHKRTNTVGVILSAGFTEFGTDKPLTEEEVKDYKKPFNVALAGVVWKTVNSELADLIQDSNDSSSANYMSISASWELGFEGYELVVLENGKKNTENAKIISEASEVEKHKEKLRAFGGEGLLDEQRVYRMPTLEVEPLGIGFTEKPAGDVKGIVVPEEKKESKASLGKENQEIQNNISQNEKPNVIDKRQEIMKLNSISDITDESLKTCTAASISEVISVHVREKSQEWEKTKAALDTKVQETEALATKTKEDLDKANLELKKITDALASLEQEKKDREAVDKFNERMGKINEDYELDDEIRAAILDEVKAIDSDEAFAKYQKKAEALFKPFKKGAKKDDKKAEKTDKEKSDEAKAALDAALENGKKDKSELPNSSKAEDKTLVEKYKSAFAMDQFVIKTK